MISMDQARRAKVTLKDRLGSPAWLNGIGVGRGNSGYCVQVNVTALSDEVRRALPGQVDGVEVRVEVVGQIARLKHGS